MKTSIRNTRFTIGMILFLFIILLLSVSSAYYLNKLSGKTSAILKENHVSVVYARDMSDAITNINQVTFNSVLTHEIPDTLRINDNFILFNNSLKSELNNITEIGEQELASDIEKNYYEYRESVLEFIKSPDPVNKIFYLQTKFDTLNLQLMQLSQMNVKAIEVKTDDAKVSAKKFTLQMTIIGTICFLIAYGFTFTFSSYFNDRFYRLYKGIKDLVSDNYNHKLHLDGNDELTEIASAFNEMVEKLDKSKQKMSVPLHDDLKEKNNLNDINELKNLLLRIKTVEEQAIAIISGFEKK